MDRNKTPLTNTLEQTTVAWLARRGFIAIEREVGYAGNRIADVAAWSWPTQTESVNLGACGLKLDRLRPVIVLMEIKASRSDFFSDGDKFSRLYADLNYLVYPHGLLADDEIPEGWFGLKTNSEGTRVIKLVREHARHHQPTDRETLDWITVLWHAYYCRCAYKMLREEQRKERVADLERRITLSISSWINALTKFRHDPSMGLAKLLYDQGVLSHRGMQQDYVLQKIHKLESLIASPAPTPP